MRKRWLPRPRGQNQRRRNKHGTERRYQKEREEIREMFRNGEINSDTQDLLLDDLDRRYPEEDLEEADEYPLDLSDYLETFD